MKRLAVAIISGLIFGLGLVISGMMNPAKVIGFLDIAGNWDPSLAIVLAGASGITMLTFRLILKRQRPILDTKFHTPTRTDVDSTLVVGAGIFGIGWGVVGFCPGPVYATLLLGRSAPLVVFVSMIAGMTAFKCGNAYVAHLRGKVSAQGGVA